MSAGYYVACLVFVGLCLALLWPTHEEIRRFEGDLERGFEPSTFLELGVVLVVLAAVCVAATVFKHAMGAP